jgi:hypothetical protein
VVWRFVGGGGLLFSLLALLLVVLVSILSIISTITISRIRITTFNIIIVTIIMNIIIIIKVTWSSSAQLQRKIVVVGALPGAALYRQPCTG